MVFGIIIGVLLIVCLVVQIHSGRPPHATTGIALFDRLGRWWFRNFTGFSTRLTEKPSFQQTIWLEPMGSPQMKILAFAATNSRKSINRALVEYAADQLHSDIRPDAEIEILDLNDFEMPIYSIDRETEGGIPAEAKLFFDRIGAADAVLVSFAEHNGFVTSAWKNIFDWMSRIDTQVWQHKSMAMLAATPGRRAGVNVMASQEMLAPFYGAHLRGSLGIGTWSEAWDPDAGKLVRPDDIKALDELLARLVAPAEDQGIA